MQLDTLVAVASLPRYRSGSFCLASRWIAGWPKARSLGLVGLPAPPQISNPPQTFPSYRTQQQIAPLPGFERDEVAKSSGENAHCGPIGPQHDVDRAASRRHCGPASDAVSLALRTALEKAIAGGRPVDAAELASALASRVAAPSVKNVVPFATLLHSDPSSDDHSKGDPYQSTVSYSRTTQPWRACAAKTVVSALIIGS